MMVMILLAVFMMMSAALSPPIAFYEWIIWSYVLLVVPVLFAYRAIPLKRHTSLTILLWFVILAYAFIFSSDNVLQVVYCVLIILGMTYFTGRMMIDELMTVSFSFLLLACVYTMNPTLDLIHFTVFTTVAFILAILTTLIGYSLHDKRDSQNKRQPLMRLIEAGFDCLTADDYSTETYRYEKRLHDAKLNYERTIQHHETDARLDRIHSLVLELMQLRFRVKDRNTLMLCRYEVDAFKKIILKCLATPSVIITPLHSRELESSLMQLEMLNERVIQVASNEPGEFYYFMLAAQSLCRELQSENESS